MIAGADGMEENFPEGAFYAQSLHHRLSLRHWPDDAEVQKDADTWLAQAGIDFGDLEVIVSADPTSTRYFEGYLNAAHVLRCLAQRKPGQYPVEGVQAYLRRQQNFAENHGFVSWVVEIAIARTLLYQVSGKKYEALEALAGALRAAGPTGLLRVFVDECEPLQALLEEQKHRLADKVPVVYANRLLGAMSCRPDKAETGEKREALLSERELEVLHHLARGLSYEEVGQQLFLSLNTIQFHVKNIYGKLLVNKGAQAIDKALEMNLI